MDRPYHDTRRILKLIIEGAIEGNNRRGRYEINIISKLN